MNLHFVKLALVGSIALWALTTPISSNALEPKMFLVFFDFGSTTLNRESQKVVAEFADIDKKLVQTNHYLPPHDKIFVVGHSDTAEAAELSPGLSERRAGAVKSALVRLGLDESRIVVVGRGAREPLVFSGPNIRLQVNRFVDIDWECRFNPECPN
jgi:outer membrane protein OmpA-like peptidoglycan-associated protein